MSPEQGLVENLLAIVHEVCVSSMALWELWFDLLDPEWNTPPYTTRKYENDLEALQKKTVDDIRRGRRAVGRGHRIDLRVAQNTA